MNLRWLSNKNYLLTAMAAMIGMIILFYRDVIGYSLGEALAHHPWYGIFLIAIIGYLVYLDYPEIKNKHLHPHLIIGSITTGISFLFLWVANIGGVLVLGHLALITFIAGCLLLFLGHRYFFHFFTMLILIMVWLGGFDQFLYLLSPCFQSLAAFVAHFILNILGIGSIKDGINLELPHIILVVEPSCNGINHIFALVVLSLVLASSHRMNAWRKILLIFVTFLVGIIVNGIRVAAIGVWSYYFRDYPLHGPGDIFYVTFIFTAGALLIIWIASRIKGYKRNKVPVEVQSAAQSVAPEIRIYSLIIFMVITIGFGIMIFTFALKPVKLNFELNKAFQSPHGWSEQHIPQFWPFMTIKDADNTLDQLYFNDTGDSILVHIDYLAQQEQDREVVNSRTTLLHRSANAENISLSADISLNLVRAGAFDRKGDILFLYWVNGEFITGRLSAKLATIRSALIYRQNNAAFILIQISPATVQNPQTKQLIRHLLNSFAQKMALSEQ